MVGWGRNPRLGCCLAGEAQEVAVDLQADGPALFRVELGGHEVAPGVGAAKGHTIGGSTRYVGSVIRGGVVAVYKVEVTRRWNSLKHGVVNVKLHAVPAHVGDLQTCWQPLDSAGDDAEARGITLFGSVQQELQAQADAEEGPAVGYKLLDRSDQVP